MRSLLVTGLLAAAGLGVVSAFQNDFSSYPASSQSCLTDAANASKCTGDNAVEMNTCLCGNGGNFIYNTSSCLAKKDPNDLETVYATLQNNCEGTGTTIAVSKAAFMAQASAATATTALPSATASTSSTPTSSSSPTTTTGGLSIGAIVGIAFGGVAVILVAIFIWVYHRRRYTAGRPRKDLDLNSGYSPHSEIPGYAHSHRQSDATELRNMGWQTPSTVYGSSMDKKPHEPAEQPLLSQPQVAELGNTVYQVPPQELAGDETHYAHSGGFPSPYSAQGQGHHSSGY